MTRAHVGPEILARLLPQRRPFSMVDRLQAVDHRPSITTARLISSNESIFDGHFPELPMWPGVFTIEAMAQSCQLFMILKAIADERSTDLEHVVRDLEAAGRALRGEPTRGGRGSALLSGLEVPRDRWGVVGRVDVKLEHPVWAGDTLNCRVTPAESFARSITFTVEAWTEHHPSASGRLVVSRIPSPEQP